MWNTIPVKRWHCVLKQPKCMNSRTGGGKHAWGSAILSWVCCLFNFEFLFKGAYDCLIGLLRDAEQQFRSALKLQPHVTTYLELVNVYTRLDLPNTALDLLKEACENFTAEPRLPLGMARLYDMLNDGDNAMIQYKRVLVLDSSNIEAIACLGAHYFYTDQVSCIAPS
jgi:tetratricopeptide (TPR) repeat protein